MSRTLARRLFDDLSLNSTSGKCIVFLSACVDEGLGGGEYVELFSLSPGLCMYRHLGSHIRNTNLNCKKTYANFTNRRFVAEFWQLVHHLKWQIIQTQIACKNTSWLNCHRSDRKAIFVRDFSRKTIKCIWASKWVH